jgi:hypothetical protein
MRSVPARFLLAFGCLVLGASTVAAEPVVPVSEALALPTTSRLAAIGSVAQREGWKAQMPVLRATAEAAYAQGHLAAADNWLHVYRWSAIFAQSDDQFLPQWIQAVENAHVGHNGMATQYHSHGLPLGAFVSPECQQWLISHPSFSDAFFGMVRPVDFLPEVLKILSDLQGRDLARFERYANLALAIAVVHDLPPPPDWPHAQVSTEALPRRWPSASEAFDWWTTEDMQGRTFQPLSRLEADELKFVVDSAAPFDELEWSQKVANYPLDQLDRAYKMIAYRSDRAANVRPMWAEKDYSLPTILGAGGICVDQAYFAAHVGKARGVPTLIFQGAGSNGRHAWFGYLNSKQQWQLDAGRYREQRFVTGIARDPQTWGPLSDHELKFLAERFHTQKSFRESAVHAEFAAHYLAGGDAPAAETAARKAIGAERRNQQAWEVLLAAQKISPHDIREQETTLGEAMSSFQHYPDLEVYYSNLLSGSLRNRGEVQAADAEAKRVALKYQSGRSDLSLQQAREGLIRSEATQPLADQIRGYEEILHTFGRGAGIAFFDEIVVPFVEHLQQLHRPLEARQAAESARAALKVELNSQLEQEFEMLLKRVRPPPQR